MNSPDTCNNYNKFPEVLEYIPQFFQYYIRIVEYIHQLLENVIGIVEFFPQLLQYSALGRQIIGEPIIFKK